MKNTATITQTNRPRAVLKLALALVLALTLIPFMPGNVSEAEAVELQEGVGQVTIGLDGTTLTNTTKVGFGGKEWVMIGYNGTGVASDANTMTLLLASGQIYTSSEFDSTNTSNAYSTSTLKTAMEGLVPTG